MKKVTTILALMLVQNSYALELEGINGVNILAIDGKTIKTNFFAKKINQLEAGEHQIVVRYSEKFQRDKLLESRPAIFNIDIQQDTKISVSKINNYQQAQRAIRDGVAWQVISTDNQYVINNSDSLVGKGFMPYSDIERLVTTYNQEHNITTQGETSLSKMKAASVDADLVTHYQQSTLTEKKAFRLWLLEQDMK